MQENERHARDSRLSWEELRKAADLDLISELARGNDDALAVIVDRFQRLVFSVALRIVKNKCEAEDVVQNVFLDIFRRAGQFDASRGTLKMWILQYAYTRSINRHHYLEQRRFYSQTEMEVEPFAFVAEPANAIRLSPAETVRFIQQTLGMLNDRQARAINLIYFQGLTLAEAAEKSGESLPAIRHHYYRGLMKMREVIKSGTKDSATFEASAQNIQLEVSNLKTRAI